MDIFAIIGLALIAVTILVVLRQSRPEMALHLTLAVGIIIFLLLVGRIGHILEALQGLAGRAQINQFYLSTILRIIGIAYIAEFGAQICRDAGENTIASRVEFAAQIIIMVMALPIIAAVIETILRLLP